MQNLRIAGWIFLATTLAVLLSACAGTTPPEPVKTGIFSTEPAWTFSVKDTIVSSPVTDGTLVFIRTTKQLIAIDPQTAEQVWTAESPARWTITSPPVVVNDIILAPELDGSLAAFTTEDGKLLWRKCNVCLGAETISSMAAVDDAVFVARANDKLTAYDLLTGDILWKGDSPTHVFPQVVAYGSQVYIAGNKLIKIYDSSTGDLVRDEHVERFVDNITLGANILYIFSTDQQGNKPYITSFEVYSRDVLWSVPYPSKQDLVIHYLTLHKGTLYVTGGDVILALSSRDGQTLWQFPAAREFERAIVSDEGLVLARASDKLYAVDSSTGEELGNLELFNQIGSGASSAELSPVIFDDLAIVPISNNWVFAYPLPDADSK